MEAPLKGSQSYEQLCVLDAGLDSPPEPEQFRLHTPKFHAGLQARAALWGSKGCSSSADTDLSKAETGERGWAPPLPGHGSPAAPRKPQVYSEQQRRVLQPPSAPQKEGSKVHKRHSAPPLVGNALSERPESGDELPDPRRALDMSEADPHNVNQLSLSPMNMASPACISSKLARTSAVLEAAEERAKRQRRGVRVGPVGPVHSAPPPIPQRSPAPAFPAPDAPMASPVLDSPIQDSPPLRAPPRFDSLYEPASPVAPSPPSRQRMKLPSPPRAMNSWRGSGVPSDEALAMAAQFAPVPISRMNSMRDTKLLFVNKDKRSASFCLPSNQDGGFKFDDHFIWLNPLGSGSFSDVYAVRQQHSSFS